MTYNLILIAIAVIAVSIATALSKNGPKWKGPLIAVVIYIVVLLFVDFLGLNATG